jgi:multidrug efflux pump subunit AcrA (membrane-fusion protein)
MMRTGRGEGNAEGRFQVRASLTGVITEVLATNGSAVEQGVPLFRMVALDAVHVVAHVPESEVPRLSASVDATARVPGSDADVALGQPISRGRLLDPASRTLPLVFRLVRPAAQIAIGQRVTVRLLTGAREERVAVPVSALVDDGGRQVVFVQASGESFERRPVTPGPRDAGFVAVEGVTAGDRVVVRGAPLVRLASLSTQVPAHGHVH